MKRKDGRAKAKPLRNKPVFSGGFAESENAQTNAFASEAGTGYRTLSLFSGCGGMDLGFHGGFQWCGRGYSRTNFNVVSAFDYDADCVETYRLNIGEAHREDLSQTRIERLPSADVLMGGFPCQDFSSSGTKLGTSTERGQLYRVLVAYADHHRPRLVVGENVPMLARLHGGAYLSEIREAFDDIDYRLVVWRVVCQDFGLPQSRTRLFLIATPNHAPLVPEFSAPRLSMTIDDALRDLESVSSESVVNQSQYYVADVASAGGARGPRQSERKRGIHDTGQRAWTHPIPLFATTTAHRPRVRSPPRLSRRIRVSVHDSAESETDWKCGPAAYRAPCRSETRCILRRKLDRHEGEATVFGPMNDRLLEEFLEPLRVCMQYKPAFGGAVGLTLEQFEERYGADVFYDLIGLASEPLYVAHKAAGGLTSFYRQLGIACERLTRSVFVTSLGLEPDQVKWFYKVANGSKERTLTLDARLIPADIPDEKVSDRVRAWLNEAAVRAGTSPEVASRLSGAVFEIRQGYKSADSKCQNADIGFGVQAFKEGYLPCVLVFSGQVSEVVADRYRKQGLYVMLGSSSPIAHESTFNFFREAVGWDLEA